MKNRWKLRGRRTGRSVIAAAALTVTGGIAVTALATPPTQYVWSGNGGSGYFTTGANWIGGVPIPTSGNNEIVFGPRNDYGSAPFANGSYGVAGIYFNSSAAAFTVEDLPITIGASGIEDDAANSEAILNNLVLSSTQTWEIGNGSAAKLTLGGTQNLSSQTLTIQCNGSSTMTANLIGTGTVYTGGSGTLTLNGSSSFTGTIYVQGAGLVIPTGASLSPSNTRVVTSGFNLSGGTINGSATFGYLATGPITAQISSGSWSGPQFDVGFGYAATLTQSGGTLSSTFLDIGAFNGGIALAGAGTFNLSAGTVNTAVLAIGSDDASGVFNQTGGTTNASSASIGGAHNGSATVSGSSSSFEVTGGLTLGSNGGTGNSTLTISNNALSVVTGQTLLNSSSSTLNISSAAFFQTGSLAGMAGSTVLLTNSAGNSALNFQPGTAMSGTFRGTISGTGGLFLNSNSITENLLGTNTFTGPVTVHGGTLEMASGASTTYQTGGTTLTGTLILDFGNYGTSTLNAGTNGTIDFNTSSVTGGVLTGSGVYNASSVTSFNGTNFASGSTIYLDTSGTSLTNTLVQGTIGAIGTTTIRGGFNLSGGTFNGSFGGLSNYELLIDSGSATATATALVVSGTLIYNGLLIGGTGPGLLNQSGGLVTGSTVVVGANDAPGAAGAFNLGGGSVSAGTPFIIGDVGPGTMTQTGGSLTAPAVFIGSYGTANGSATVSGSGSTWNITGDSGIGIALGVQANGQLTVSNGAKITCLGELIPSSTGSSVNISNATLIATALSGAGTVTLADPAGGTALTLNGAGDAFTGNIGGTGSILFNGSGTQTLTGVNTFTGKVTVTSGTLEMTSGSASTYQASGGTLQFDSGNLGTSTVRADGTGKVVFNTNTINGGLLTGTGAYNVASVRSFLNTNLSSTSISINEISGGMIFTNVSSAGPVTFSGLISANNWTTFGTVTVGGQLNVASGSYFNVSGGTTTVSPFRVIAPNGTGVVNVTGATLNNNNGTISGQVNLYNAGVLLGNGSTGSVDMTAANTGFFPGGGASPGLNFALASIQVSPPGTSFTAMGPINTGVATQVTVNAGDGLTLAGGLSAGSNTLTKTGPGTLKTASLTAGTLNVASGSIQLSAATGTVLVTNLLLASGTTLDLNTGSAVIGQTPLSICTADVAAGYNFPAGGHWNGLTSITSAAAAADPSYLTAVGVIGNNQSGSPLYSAAHQFHGYAPNTNDTLLAYTYFGDANLDGKVDGSDYSLIDAGYASHGSKAGWYYGDFNYDGVVDGSDYTLIDNAFNNQGSSLSTAALGADATALVAAVPEPGAVMFATEIALLALARRRGRGRA